MAATPKEVEHDERLISVDLQDALDTHSLFTKIDRLSDKHDLTEQQMSERVHRVLGHEVGDLYDDWLNES